MPVGGAGLHEHRDVGLHELRGMIPGPLILTPAYTRAPMPTITANQAASAVHAPADMSATSRARSSNQSTHRSKPRSGRPDSIRSGYGLLRCWDDAALWVNRDWGASRAMRAHCRRWQRFAAQVATSWLRDEWECSGLQQATICHPDAQVHTSPSPRTPTRRRSGICSPSASNATRRTWAIATSGVGAITCTV